jgi:hypothetical protein
MAAIVEARRPFLGPRDVLTATPWGIQYTHITAKGLKVADAQLDPLLAWMRQLIAVLEPVSPGPQPTAAAPAHAPYAATSSQPPAEYPYGAQNPARPPQTW